MIATFLVAASILAAEHKPGETCTVVCRDKEVRQVIAATDPGTLARIVRGIDKGDLKPLFEAEEDGTLVKIPNATFDGDRAEFFAGKVLQVVDGQGDLPGIAKIDLITEKGRGRVVYLRDEYLMSAAEMAAYIGELEEAERKAKEVEAKLAAIDPAEVGKALKAARNVGSRADLSTRKKALARERSKAVAQLARTHGVPTEALDAWIKAKGIEK